MLKSRIVTRKTDFPNKVEPTLNKTEEIRSTFTLDIDDEGNLVGLNIDKQKTESKQERFIKIKNLVSKFSKSKETEDKSGFVGKIKGIFSKIKLKKTNDEEGSKISNILKRIKGIFSKS